MLPETVTAVPTAYGDVHLRGDLTGRPVALLISGVFEAERAYSRFQEYLPKVDALVAHLPGNHCPALRDFKIETMGAAFDEAVANLPKLIVVGVSTGGLVGLAMRSPKVAGLVLADPPLRPHQAWPLHSLREQGPADRWPLINAVFGLYRGRTEPRNYAPLLSKLSVPTTALVGAEALGKKRPIGDMPSLVDARSLGDLEAHPLVSVQTVPGVGHNVPHKAGRVFVDAINAMADLVL